MKKSLGMVVDVRVWMSEFLRGGGKSICLFEIFSCLFCGFVYLCTRQNNGMFH